MIFPRFLIENTYHPESPIYHALLPPVLSTLELRSRMQSLSQGPNRSILVSAVLSGYIHILTDLGLLAIALTTQETLMCLKHNRIERAPLKKINHLRV